MGNAVITLRFAVIGKAWKIRSLTTAQYIKKKVRNNSVAITYFHKRRIDLSPEGSDHESIVHELVHAYLYEMCTHSADLTTDAQEEIFCELLAKRGLEILTLADTLVARIKKCKALV